MIEISDQMNNMIRLEDFPERIISLVPSQTELLFDLGLGDKVVGITKFCIHPDEWYQNKKRVGGTKTIDFDLVDELQPDLIIANKEENTKEMIQTLQEKYQVYVSDILTTTDGLDMIQSVSILTGKKFEGQALITEILNSIENWPQFNKKVLYFMWNGPLMIAGRNTFIGDVLKELALVNGDDDSRMRYREIEIEEIKEIAPEFLLLSTEPFPFADKHKKELEEATGIKTIIVDGEMFSWYGSRMRLMKDYFDTIHDQFELV